MSLIHHLLAFFNNVAPDSIGVPKVSIDNGIQTVLNVVFEVVGAVSVIYIVIGGIKYTISGGDPAGLKSAKETITYALVGLIIALLAFGAVNFLTTTAGNLAK